MAKQDKRLKEIMQYRIDGMIYALNIVKTKGIEELEKDIAFRKITYVPLEVSIETIDNIMYDIFTKIYNSYNVAVYKVLNKVFGFCGKRLHEFDDAFNETMKDLATTSHYGEMLYTFEDYAKVYNEKYDMGIDMDKIEQVDVLNYNSSNSGVSMQAVQELLTEHGYKDASLFLGRYMRGEEEWA